MNPYPARQPDSQPHMPPGDRPDPTLDGQAIPLPGRRPNRHTAFLVLTVLAGLGGIALESGAHILAGSPGDPLPHGGYLAAYLFAVLVPIPVAFLLARPSRSAVLLSLAVAANAASLVIALAMSFALLPVLPFALLLSLFVVGIAGLSPYLLFALGVGQWFGLRVALREANLSPRHGAFAAVLTAAGAAAALFVQPFFVGRGIGQAFRAGISAGEERAVAGALHRLGGDAAVLTLCYRTPLPLWERLGASSGVDDYYWGHTNDDATVKSARRLYFLMKGQSYAAAPVPWTVGNYRSEQWINDVAGEEVGGTRVGLPVPKLSLASVTGSETRDARTATAEWTATMTLANEGDTANEARAEILLPPGAVLHQASLWIGGRECQAAFGPQATVRRAYRTLAVVERRDPLLVTMPTPGKLFVQCFPVPAHGRMTVRLGVTLPLAPDPADRRRAAGTSPAFGAVNFAVAGDPRTVLARGVVRRGAASVSLPAGVAWSERASAPPPVKLLVAVDTGARMSEWLGGAARTSLDAALSDLPAGSAVTFADAGSGALSAGIPAMRGGGIDAVPVLTRLVREKLSGGAFDAVLYLHGAVPDSVSDPAPLARAIKALPARPNTRPRFYSLLLAPNAPDALGDRLAMQANARVASVAQYENAGMAVTGTVERVVSGDAAPGTNAAPGDPDAEASRARLRDYRAALAAWYAHSNFGAEALSAARTAASLHLVTPLSGAVVLQTEADYKRNGLDHEDDAAAKHPAHAVVSSKSVAPEAGSWVLVVAGGVVAVGGGVLVRGRGRLAPAPS